MSAVSSTMLELGTGAPAFALPDTGGKVVSLSDFDDARTCGEPGMPCSPANR